MPPEWCPDVQIQINLDQATPVSRKSQIYLAVERQKSYNNHNVKCYCSGKTEVNAAMDEANLLDVIRRYAGR